VKVKERVKGKEVESESERACDFTDVLVHDCIDMSLAVKSVDVAAAIVMHNSAP
jgi:hypothetical protein